MSSIQVFRDIPAVHFQDDELLRGMWQPEPQNMAGCSHPEVLSPGDKAFHHDVRMLAPWPERTFLDTVAEPGHPGSPSPLTYHTAYGQVFQPFPQRLPPRPETITPWQTPGLIHDEVASPSDSSQSSQSERSFSHGVSVGSGSSATDEYVGSVTCEYGPYEYQPPPYASLSSFKNVSPKELQYEQDLDEPQPSHIDELNKFSNGHPYPGDETEECSCDGDSDDDTYHEGHTMDQDDDKSSDYTPRREIIDRRARCRDSNNALKPHGHGRSTMRSRAGVTKNKSPKQRQTRFDIQGQGAQGAERRRFICSFSHYGCASAFVNKNEWKRHVLSQHLQLGFYRCDIGDCVPTSSHVTSRRNSSGQVEAGYNDFNRKDLFTQHLRRMHTPWRTQLSGGRPIEPTTAEKNEFEASLEDIRQRCWQERRDPPERSVCGFCNQIFEGKGSWEDRMEHVGRHHERDEEDESEDEELTEYAFREGIIRQRNDGNGYKLV
ncbi:putative c2h2 finger domain [Phaeomoniella chlamydospora]|uniref:Putative c2h2 finger domain n=1 Tax=Phaeomoniella chlamydospora TaxID=158046 RepID=A0A0G2DWG3_PHACM|nr:putative c2h2 finger domain [Phaeomoniella chlamydospora]